MALCAVVKATLSRFSTRRIVQYGFSATRSSSGSAIRDEPASAVFQRARSVLMRSARFSASSDCRATPLRKYEPLPPFALRVDALQPVVVVAPGRFEERAQVEKGRR